MIGWGDAAEARRMIIGGDRAGEGEAREAVRQAPLAGTALPRAAADRRLAALSIALSQAVAGRSTQRWLAQAILGRARQGRPMRAASRGHWSGSSARIAIGSDQIDGCTINRRPSREALVQRIRQWSRPTTPATSRTSGTPQTAARTGRQLRRPARHVVTASRAAVIPLATSDKHALLPIGARNRRCSRLKHAAVRRERSAPAAEFQHHRHGDEAGKHANPPRCRPTTSSYGPHAAKASGRRSSGAQRTNAANAR